MRLPHVFGGYPALGAFMSARSYQTTTGVQHFYDQHDLGAKEIRPDSFFFDAAAKVTGHEHEHSPMFVFDSISPPITSPGISATADSMPQWTDLGNVPPVDEYLRRQALSAQNYADFKAQLKRQYPNDSFLLVRFGDHQPVFCAQHARSRPRR